MNHIRQFFNHLKQKCLFRFLSKIHYKNLLDQRNLQHLQQYQDDFLAIDYLN